ncbi:MAG: PaaI family thioesterase [Polyangiaceae bacterium]|nr:PaaI family thioesterase [Polyangiaceae bacterium]
MDMAIQADYPAELNQCFGCGQLNPHGHRLKSYWRGDEVVASFVPEPFHMAAPGFVYGGLIASLIDCHGTGTAAAFARRATGRERASLPPIRFVTASLKVDFLRPTPLGPPLELRARARGPAKRRAIVDVELSVNGVVRARGEVVAVQLPRSMLGQARLSFEP